MRVGILCPMEDEVKLVAQRMGRAQDFKLAGMQAHQGVWRSHQCIVVKSGLGKVAAAAVAQALISSCEVDAIVVVGLAGALVPSLQVGDVVIADRLIQHDLDARPLFDYTLIPDLRVKWVETDMTLRRETVEAVQGLLQQREEFFAEDIRRRFGMLRPSAYVGQVLTGDQFVSKPALIRLRELFPEALCVEMEGAAVGQVCRMNEVPFVVVRIVSDRADDGAAIDFSRFLTEVASVYVSAICDVIVRVVDVSTAYSKKNAVR